MQLVDSHCHINFPDFQDRMPDILQNAADNQINHMLCIATSWENFPDVLTLARDHAPISASVGVHPTTEGGHEPTVDELLSAAAEKEVVAIGETGLDYFRSTGDLTWQHERFHRHIEVAKRCNKPLIIHTRAAAEDTMNTLRDHQARDAGGVMHCFAEDWEVAKQALDIGFYISFSGIVTFKSAKAIQEVARKAPLDRILVETDAPYLAPVPHRGKTNEPAFVRHTAEYVAELRDIPLEELAEATTSNFFTLFSDAAELAKRQSA
ncbi:TatD family hydrolase [Granulosicoccus sp. 3-233]|uniref:TatD family hydrolase n=1 Tax=Granulosicoccus sp. 3-233 TaxID=3417969 RepID=UPI003D327314